jgi:hypothetical protein
VPRSSPSQAASEDFFNAIRKGFAIKSGCRRTQSSAAIRHVFPDGQRALADGEELLDQLIVTGVPFFVRLEHVPDLQIILGCAGEIRRF